MGQTLTNGIFLPNKGERNCYEGLAGNWRAIDGYIGDYNVHVADAVIHVSQADRDKWDAVTGKADASALTAHTGDTTIHVTAADKQTWDAVTAKADASALTAHTGDTTIHVTAEDKTKWDAVTTKANDADVLHKNAAETMPETLTFLKNPTVKNEDVTIGSTTGGGSRFINFTDANNNALGSLTVSKISNGSTAMSLRVDTTDNNDANINSQFQFFITKNGAKVINPSVDRDIALGRSSNRWSDVQTYKVNNLEPSSLSLPSGNLSDVIDISGYLTVLDGSSANTYVAPANGWISITMRNSSGIQAYINGLWGHQIVRPSVGGVRFLMPILKNLTAIIIIFNGAIDNARFIPCAGNL